MGATSLVVGGLAVVAQTGGRSLNVLGVVAALGGAVAPACYFLLGERGVAASSPLVLAFWSMLFTAAFWSNASGWWTSGRDSRGGAGRTERHAGRRGSHARRRRSTPASR